MYNDYYLQDISDKMTDNNTYLDNLDSKIDSMILQNNNNNDLVVKSIEEMKYSNNIYLGTLILFVSVIMLAKFLPKKNLRKGWEVKFKWIKI